MTILPILGRELLSRARRPATFWLRLPMTVLALLVCLPSLLDPRFVGGGKSLFEGLVAGIFVLCCCACLSSIDAVSRERREGTLDLLLLTRVKGLDLVLGKIGAFGISTFFTLVAISPVLMLSVLAGGVTGPEVFRKALALANALFLSLAIGLAASTGTNRTFASLREAVCVALFIILVPLGLWELAPPPWRFPGLFSPVVALISGGDYQYRTGGALPYWASIALVHALSWALLLAASFRLKRGPIQTSDTPRAPRQLPLTPEAVQTRAREWKNARDTCSPVEWLVAGQKGIRGAFWTAGILVLFLQSLLPLALTFRGGIGSWWIAFTQVPSLASHVISGILIAWGASRFFAQAKQTGVLELLFTTPLTTREIILGQRAALQKLLLGPLIVMILPTFIFLVAALLPKRGSITLTFQPIYALISILTVYLSLRALVSTALLLGFKSRTQSAAIIGSVLLVKVLPYLVFFAFFTLVRLTTGPTPFYYQILQPFISIGAFLLLIVFAERRLNAELRGATVIRKTL